MVHGICTWITGKRFFGNQFSTFGSPGNPSQGIHYGVAHKTQRERETESVPRAIGTGTSFARDDEKIKGTIPMPMFARRPSTMSSTIPVGIPQNPMVGQQRQQISELLDTWNQSGLQENVFGNQCSMFDSPRDYPQRIQSDNVHGNREAVPEAGRTKTIHTSEDRQIHGTIPMPTCATKPWTTSSTMPVELPLNYMVRQQRQQTSELQFDRFPIPHSFLCWKIRFKNQVTTWYAFTIGHYVMDQRSGDGRFIGRIKIVAIGCWQEFSKL